MASLGCAVGSLIARIPKARPAYPLARHRHGLPRRGCHHGSPARRTVRTRATASSRRSSADARCTGRRPKAWHRQKNLGHHPPGAALACRTFAAVATPAGRDCLVRDDLKSAMISSPRCSQVRDVLKSEMFSFKPSGSLWLRMLRSCAEATCLWSAVQIRHSQGYVGAAQAGRLKIVSFTGLCSQADGSARRRLGM
jgi:hypothetical protein